VFVDAPTTARAEKGELLIAEREGAFDVGDVRAELGAVVAGGAGWRRGPDERTLYASCGSAIEAFGAAVAALSHAFQRGSADFTFS